MLVPSPIRVKLEEILALCDYEISQANQKAAVPGLPVQQAAYWTAYSAQVASAKTELLGVFDVV